MTPREFAALHQSCSKSLERFQKESQQTLELLLRTAQFPTDSATQALLQTQRDEEDRAKLDYQQRRRELFTLVAQG